MQYGTFIFGYFQVEGTQPGGDGKLKLEFNLKAGASQTPHCPNNYVNHVHCPKNICLKTEHIIDVCLGFVHIYVNLLQPRLARFLCGYSHYFWDNVHKIGFERPLSKLLLFARRLCYITLYAGVCGPISSCVVSQETLFYNMLEFVGRLAHV